MQNFSSPVSTSAVKPQPHPIDSDLLMPLTKFVALLPGAKPRVFKEKIGNDFFKAIDADPEATTFEHEGITVTLAQYNETRVLNSNETDCVTPTGATWLLDLYAKGLMPMSHKKLGSPADEAIAYSRTHDDLVRQTTQQREVVRAAAETYAAKLANPGSISESEFTYALLNDLSFRARPEGGPCEFEVGGLSVAKHVTTLRSNSAKTPDSRVSFQWRSGGELYTIDKESRFAGNRGNDPERNWGLPKSGF